MPIDSTTINQMKQNFDNEVEVLLKRKGLHRYMGTDVLDPVQQVVNQVHADLDTVHTSPSGNTSQVEAITSKGLMRVTGSIDAIQTGMGTSTSNLGSIGGEMSMLDSPAWSKTIGDVTLAIEKIGSQYGQIMVNQPDKNDFDKGLASILETIEYEFQRDSSPAKAAQVRKNALVQIQMIEAELYQRRINLVEASLSNLITQKEIDLLNMVSVLKQNESSLSKSELEVISLHRTKAMEHLAKIKQDQMSYDRAILQQHLRVFDQIVAPLQQMREGVQYRAALSGGNFSSPRRPSTKTFGFGSVPDRRGGSPFRGAPDTIGFRGFGSVADVSASSQMKKVDPNTAPEDMDGAVVDMLNTNLETGIAQGYITPADEAIIREQFNRLNISVFGNDQQLFEASQVTFRNTIDDLSQKYINKVKAGEIDGNLPPSALEESKYPEGYKPVNSFFSRLGTTIGLGAGVLFLGSLGLAYILSTRALDKVSPPSASEPSSGGA